MRRVGLVVLAAFGCASPAARSAAPPSPTVAAPTAAAPAPVPVRLADWVVPHEGMPWVGFHGNGSHVVIDVTLRPVDARAAAVVIVMGPYPHQEEPGGGLLPLSCDAGPIVAEVPRATFDAAAGHATQQLAVRFEIVPPDLRKTYAFLTCLRDADGRLARTQDGLAHPASARSDAFSSHVLTPSGPIASRNLSGGVLLTHVPGAVVEAPVMGEAGDSPEACHVVELSSGRLVHVRDDAAVWVAKHAELRPALSLVPGDEVIEASLERSRIVARTPGYTCPDARRLDVVWPDAYFENGLLIGDAGKQPSPPPAMPVLAPWGERPVVARAQPEPESWDCQLGVALTVGTLPSRTRAVAIAVAPHRGPAGTRERARCETIVAELPRALATRAATWLVTLQDGVDCDGAYDVIACLRDDAGQLTPAEPLARYGRAGPTCVAEGTPIETVDGPRPVEWLERGDRLVTWDVERQRPVVVQVRRVARHTDRPTARFLLAGGGTLEVTAEHLLYVVERGGFARAREVDAGSTLLAADGTPVTVMERSPFDTPRTVYDITVDGPRTYVAGGVLVHNY